LNSFRIDVSFATFISEFKAATKKFKTFKADLIRAFEEIEKNPRAGDQIPRTGSDLFKIRLGVKGQIGKRGGYRLIYHVDWSRQVITPIALYFKPDVPNLPDAEVTRRFGELIRQNLAASTATTPESGP
jgi:mRNA-degrading endonuclease RelE of RelBE toxin-antitoxin system